MNEYPKTRFARSLSSEAGIVNLMDDLGEALAVAPEKFTMMGGGNPAHIPEIQAVWRDRMRQLLDEQAATFDRMLSDYDQPAGNPAFRSAVAGFLNAEFGWKLTSANVAVTNGGQSAFFFLLNRFAGTLADGSMRRILVPLVPEYIGYEDLSVDGTPLFDSRPARIEITGEREFKYRIDFEKLALNDTHGAILVSRPTNPSSNVITDEELARLSSLARERNIALIVDNAYGQPFPGVVFEEATPLWDDHVILTMSLSKLGLPGTRTGIVIAAEPIIDDIRAMTAIVGLANNNIGQALVRPLLESGEMRRLTSEIIRPFYQARANQAREMIHESLPDTVPWKIHRSEGAFFVWFWFEKLPISSIELYRLLKSRGLIIVPGDYFFFGIPEDDLPWDHSRECIRVNFSQSPDALLRGFRILGEALRELYSV